MYKEVQKRDQLKRELTDLGEELNRNGDVFLAKKKKLDEIEAEVKAKEATLMRLRAENELREAQHNQNTQNNQQENTQNAEP